MRKLLFATVLISIALASIGSATHAAPTPSLKQQILPLECVFQEVNDGTGTLIYLTPIECGQPIIPPDDGDDGGGEGETPTTPDTPSIPTVITVINTGSAVVQIPFVPVINTEPSRLSLVLGSAQYLPYAPLANVKDESSQEQADEAASNTVTVPLVVTSLGIITIVLIILLIFL